MSSRSVSRKASDINKRKSTPEPSNRTPSSPSTSNSNHHSVVLSNATAVEQYGSSSDDDFESLHHDEASDNNRLQSTTTTQMGSSHDDLKHNVVDFENSTNNNFTNVVTTLPPVITTQVNIASPTTTSLSLSPSENMRNTKNNTTTVRKNKEDDEQTLLNRIMNEYESDAGDDENKKNVDYNQVNIRRSNSKKNNEPILNSGNSHPTDIGIKDHHEDLHGYSSEDSFQDEVSPFIPQSSHKDPSSLTNREIFESIQQRNLNSSNWNTSTQDGSVSSQKAIVTTNEADEEDDDVLNYDTYRKVNWKNALLSHFCFRCGIFFLSGVLIGLTIFLTLWFAI
ncbi:hypothetical protein FDP41_013753 [Naegleria fowleri]|uniref:Uncharacterized protein n=1 Tax=Naegleria fowleri TaxID=5763 RepID=A0A6A5C5D2_NAEFO|nr:uncharacterized protein FDP41_013753 [Naegleria fowleri]KAF0980539.1 hypothetical protein FDP41_013753 [Naegleria fowleri]CAG4709436.1 unnamed protein product [Naegleria fowleri]